ncbi:MAG: zeta toxin family protein [bacterium]|nr:zeta toxin family protein [bacterium]
MKKYILIAGVNGAGKSTLYQTLPSLQVMPRVNVDEILRESEKSGDSVNILTAGKKAVTSIAQYFMEGITFHQETTLCGKWIIKNIEEAKKNGYFVELHYVGVESADIAKKRVAERVKRGGHGIPKEDIERRYVDTFHNLKIVLPKCNLAAFYDNTIAFRRFAIYQNGKPVRISKNIPDWYKHFYEDNVL